MLDLLITNVRIVDGSGNPWYRSDIGVKGEKIAAMGSLSGAKAKSIIDGRGAIACPGFIDVHTHSDLMLLADPRHEPKVRQGITTEVLGSDGLSYAPASSETINQLRTYLSGVNGNPPLEESWSSVGEFLSLFDRRVAVNVAYLIPHCALRIEAIGWEARKPSPQELERMKDLATQAIADGAVGFSTGLDYPPNSFAETEELIEICRTVGSLGGIYVTHVRGMRRWEQALAEAMRIGRETGIPVQISHVKASGPENEGRAGEILAMIDKARGEGVDVTFDSYPYNAGSGPLMVLLPGWIFEGGPEALMSRLSSAEIRARLKRERESSRFSWGTVYLAATESNEELEGKNLIEAAASKGVDPVDLVCDLLIEENLACGIINFFADADEDIYAILKHPAQMVASDAILVGRNPHPRAFGTFPRVLGRYVRELGMLRLEEAIRKMTSFPAQRFGLKDRGLLKAGFAADIVVLDEERIRDTADYWDSRRYPEGVDYVIVNGEVIVHQGNHTGALPGRALRPQG